MSAETARAFDAMNRHDYPAACQDARAALAKNSNDEKAFGIQKLTCDKAGVSKVKFKDKLEKKPLPPPGDDLGTPKKPFSASAGGPNSQGKPGEGAPGTQGGAASAGAGAPAAAPPASDFGPAPSGANGDEGVLAGTFATPPAGPGMREQPTSLEKLQESQSYANTGKLAEAIEAARQSIRLDPRNRRAWAMLASLDGDAGFHKQSLAVAEEGLKLIPNDPALLKSKAYAEIKLDVATAAVASADQLLQINPTDAAALVLKAYAQGKSGDKEGMTASLKTAAALDPSFETLLVQSQNAPAGGAPFLLPGDRPEPQARAAVTRGRKARPSKALMLALGALIIILLVVLVLLAQAIAHRRTPPSEGEPPASPQA